MKSEENSTGIYGAGHLLSACTSGGSPSPPSRQPERGENPNLNATRFPSLPDKK